MNYDAVVLDMDGVLVERSPSWVFNEAATAALERFGIEEPDEETYSRVRMSPEDPTAARRYFAETHDIAFEDLYAERNELVTANQLTAIREAEKTLYPDADALDALDVPLGIVSNNQHAAVENVLDRFGVRSRFETWYGLRPTLGDLERRKPNPAYLERALADLDAERAVYVGDRESDLETARRAGIDSAFVRRSFNEDADPETAPTYDVDSLDELVETLAGERPRRAADGGTQVG